MRTRKLELECPVCASHEVFYTCTPNCCFNHVCNQCGSTFEPVTNATGSVRTGLPAPEVLPEASDPTVACGKCESIRVFQTEAGELVCLDCGAVLSLKFTEVSPNPS